MSVRLAPSILSADFAMLGEQVAAVERGGADLIHGVDVMVDGHFVPNLTMGPAVVKALRRITKLPLDVHLMITDPDEYIGAFAERGRCQLDRARRGPAPPAPDAERHQGAEVPRWRRHQPVHPPAAIQEVVGLADQVLVMSVNPGFGGQSFIPESESKIQRVREMLDRAGSRADIEVDGGVDASTVQRVVSAGATILVAGAAVFGTPDPEAAARSLRALAVQAAGTAPRR